jgi:hypothetical protein
VAVPSGFLGAGKTKLVNRILPEEKHGKRIAVLVNGIVFLVPPSHHSSFTNFGLLGLK